MSKILVVSPVPTDPPDAGNRARILNFTKALIELGHEVHFSYIPMESADIQKMKERFQPDHFHLLPWHANKENFFKHHFRRICRFLKMDAGFLWGLDDWYCEITHQALQKLGQHHAFDIVIAEYVFFSKSLLAFPTARLKIIDTHDCFSYRHRKYLAIGTQPQWFSTSQGEEARGLMRADVVVGIQEKESEFFKEILPVPAPCQVVTVSHILNIKEPNLDHAPPMALFVGSDNPINLAGIDFFIQEILPHVARAIPDFEIHIAGGVSKLIKESVHVKPLGYVDDLDAVYQRASISINPVLMGTGINIKLLEAMAHGLACVTTESGARGLEAIKGDHLICIPDQAPIQFGDAIIKLIKEPITARTHRQSSSFAAKNWNKTQMSNLVQFLSRAQG